MKHDLAIYPAIFEPTDGVIMVSFPDVPAVHTFGDNDVEATLMATDALALALYGESRPKPSAVADVQLKANQYLVMITVDMDEARRKITRPTVRKNVTIPADLEVLARKQGLNFSEVLTKALRTQLHA
ncbi:type II toxin-antitoxin system HicB family antitoxin [Lactiplantibacillus songbeiensis]|uniref:Type II toxin-antitoxin system HicB family antitoxin n=1 Tax=Lactiplantibacillus songbeiensis TaxID=2559920 RepID=A0ABW4C223_9LACO|nr:type II toxin-antitoxin system HicB family antitoxin [Lactiplantibacillus songbeiensis]